jgi:undecaprenyl pyrophosphate synthase
MSSDLKMNIELHIQELVLYGFSQKDGERIQKEIEQELTRLFTKHGVPASFSDSYEITELKGVSFDVRAGMEVEAIGSQVAQAIYGGMGK